MSERPNRVITGFRPTSDLTVGNYLGAIQPSVALQEQPDTDLYVFVADIHGLTDTDPREIAPYRESVVRDCIALGIDPGKSTIYMQSDIEGPTVQIANRLGPYVSVAELARTPNLKEKMQAAVKKGKAEDDEAMRSNYALLGYPVLMAADIFAQQAENVAVGDDQVPHLELARAIARRFNTTFDRSVLVEPGLFAVRSLRVLSLDGKGKMSKSNPAQALLFTDDPEYARQKIKKATTAGAGEWNDAIDSHFTVAELTAQTEEQATDLATIKNLHNQGASVMKEFKAVWGDITEAMLVKFQATQAAISQEDVRSALRYNADKAERNAMATLNDMKEVMGF